MDYNSSPHKSESSQCNTETDSTDTKDTETDSTDTNSESSEPPPPLSSPAKQRPPASRGTPTRRLACSVARRLAAPPPKLLIPPTQKFNLLQKLHYRQLYGKIKSNPISEEMKVFSRLPGRLAFFIRDAVPQSAMNSGHIFLGFSKCGQFLVSYTQTGTESDQFDLNFCYHYRLHWWLFQPYAKARKVAEVTLFTNQGVYGNLHITFCQWPGDLSRIVVYGHQFAEDGEEVEPASCQSQDSGTASSRHCYLTVSAVPSLINCQDCIKVANSYDADDVAAAWNSCVRLSCLQHGLTVHTQFDLVPPYPKFEPKISLKRDNCVVVNTGNFLHSITVDMEQLNGEDVEEDRTAPSSLATPHSGRMHLNPLSSPLHPISVTVGTAEFSLGSMLGSPGGFSPASFLASCTTSDSENTDAESESGFSLPPRGKMSSIKRPLQFLDQPSGGTCSRSLSERLERVSEFTTELLGSKYNSVSIPAKRNISYQPSASSSDPFEFTVPSDRKRRMADAAYELTDDNFDVDIPEKLSTFRKKRLAEKKYEFTDDDEAGDKFVPLTRLRRRKLAEAEKAGTREVISEAIVGSGTDLMVCVSERNDWEGREAARGEDDEGRGEDECWADMLDGASYPELFSPGGCIKKDTNAMSPRLTAPHAGVAGMSPRVSQQSNMSQQGGPNMSPGKGGACNMSPARGGSLEIFCRAKFIRRYVEVDDELISVITDVEEDDLSSSTGYHNALPLEVHGSGYTQLHMVTNTKAERLNLPCVRVQQRSLDLEQFCHETATRLCARADKKFWFCNDYDVEVVDVDPASGDVTAVAVVLIQAAILTKSQVGQKYNVSSLSRKQYQAGFKFCWNIDSGQYYVVDSDSLKEISAFKEPSGVWNPARCTALPLKKMFYTPCPLVRVLTNESVIRGVSLKAIVDPDNLVALILNDLE